MVLKDNFYGVMLELDPSIQKLSKALRNGLSGAALRLRGSSPQ
jgi:hypothetical protein